MQLTRALIVAAIATFSQTAAGQSASQGAIRAAGAQWQKDIASRNVDRIVALHAPDAVVMFSNAPLVKGSGEIRALYDEMVKTPGLLLHWVPTRIEVTSPTTATEYGTYTESFDSPGGKMRDVGNYVVLWRKIDGKWRIALDAPSTITPLPAAMPAEQSAMVARSANALTWSEFSPPGFPPGGKITVLHGDPFSPGPFTLRLQLPDGYQLPLHWHPNAEYITVLGGGLQLGLGDTVDMRTTNRYTAGDFLFIPGREPIFGQVLQGGAVLQITGSGPFVLNLGVPK
jgi:ketosteroid isomerase-like protein